MGRTACMGMVLEIENGDKFPYGGGAVKPSASACSTAVQVRDQERDLDRRRRDFEIERQSIEQGGVSVQAFRHVRDDNSYDVNRQVPIFESRS